MSFETEHFEPTLPGASEAHFRLASLGLFQSLGSFRWEMVASRAALHVVDAGTGTFIEDGQACAVGPGDLYLHRPGRHYLYHDAPNAPWQYRFVTFTGPLPDDLLPPGALCPGFDAVQRTMAEIEALYRSDQMTAPHAARLAWALIADLSPAPASPPPGTLFAHLSALVARRDVTLPTVDGIARDLGIDRSTLYRRFRAETGQSIKQWLDAQRMTRAEDLLRQSNTHVKGIATICGFRDPMYFSRAFRRAHGIPPGQWRERARQAT